MELSLMLNYTIIELLVWIPWLDAVHKRKGYWKLKYEALDRIMWLTGFRKVAMGPIVRLLTFKSLPVTIFTIKFTIKGFYTVITWDSCVLYGSSKKKSKICLSKLRKIGFYNRGGVFTARYALRHNTDNFCL
jgi:hypothetical protein